MKFLNESAGAAGALLSAFSVRIALVVLLPASSVVTARMSYAPSVSADVSSPTPYGDVESVPNVDHVPAPAGERWNATSATPLPESLEAVDTFTVADTSAPSAGEVSSPAGGVLSTRRFAATAVELLPPPDVATIRRSYNPSATTVVSNEAEYGAVASVPIDVHESDPAAERWKSTCEIPVNASEAVA